MVKGKRAGKDSERKSEEPKRLAPTPDVLRELFLKSGNLCAFPDCDRLMMNATGIFIGQICHIEAAEQGGQRFNPRMTNEQRRAYGNLMLMCYEHHKETDDTEKFPVARLQRIKRDHEARFSDPGRAMLATLKDWTAHEAVAYARTLRGLDSELGWHSTEAELAESVEILREFAERLAKVPVASRKVVGLLAAREWRLKKDLRPGQQRSYELLAEDARRALQLGQSAFKGHLDILEHHGLADVERNSDGQWVIHLYGPKRWRVWEDLARFADGRNFDMERFTIDLRFDLLDEQLA